MKKLLIICLLILYSCNTRNPETLIVNGTEFENFKLDSINKIDTTSLILFKNKIIDFGKISKKNVSKVLIHFPYANIGYAKLVLLKADVSCGCMQPTYPTYPLTRGKVGVVKVLIDIKNQQGVFNKNIFIKSNAANDVEIIHIKGIIDK